MWNGFYTLSSIKDIDTLKQFFKDALEISTHARVDIKTHSSFRRERSDIKPIDYIENTLSLKDHNVCIDRIVYNGDYNPMQEEGEIGSSTMSLRDLAKYLFIYVGIEDLNKLVAKYNLKQL